MILAGLLLAIVPPPVSAALDRTDVALGERVVATYTLRAPKGSRLLVETLVTPKPPADAPPGCGPVLDFARPAPPETRSVEGEELLTQRIAFNVFATGTVAVPGPGLTLMTPDGARTSLRAPALALTVSSRLPKDQPKEKLQARPPRPVRIPSVSPWWYVSGGLLVLAIAGLVALWLRRRARPAEGRAPGASALPPGPEFLASLDRLEGTVDGLGGDPRGFYSELTHAVKRYLERRLDLPVLEWTTFETIRRLRDAGLEPPREAALPELLASADFVKFGRGAATREAARDHLGRARLLHERLEAAIARRAAEAAAESSRAPVGKVVG